MPVKTKKRTFFKLPVFAVLACSFALLSFFQLISYEQWAIFLTVVLSGVFSVLFTWKTNQENFRYIKDHPLASILIVFASILLVTEMYQAKGIPNLIAGFSPLPVSIFRFHWWILSIPAVFYLLVWIWRKAGGFLTGFWSGLDQTDKRIYSAVTIISSVAVLLLYLSNSQWYLQYDLVYSMDSGWCYQSIFPQLSYYDIRHPALSILTFPLWAFLHSILRLFAPAQFLDLLTAWCLQIVNIQLLLMIGLMIGKLSKNRWVSLFYFASFPVLLFCVFFEKYQICTFLLVLYAYQICKSRKQAGTSLVLAAGAMPTSLFLFANECLIRESIAVKLKRFGLTAIQGIGLLICAGRIHLLNPATLINEVSFMAHEFGFQDLSVRECLFSFTKMVHGSFLGLSSASGSVYTWTDILNGISIPGLILFAVIVIGIITGWKNHFVKLCSVWTICALLLFVVFQWSVQESPLFSIYFSWALIPLFQKGIQAIASWLHLPERLMNPVIFAFLLIINLCSMISIGLFFQ